MDAAPTQDASNRDAADQPAVPVLRVTGLSYAYGKTKALDDVSLELSSGRVTALLGPNGAGKTTLFSLITGLFDSRQGAIEIASHAIRRARSKALAQLGIVFQAQTLDLDLSVEQNLRYFAALRGLPGGTAQQRIAALLEEIGLTEKAKAKVRTLSGGQRRRVEVARALLDRPALLLLDEPSTGLDISTRRWLVEHIHRIAREDGIAILMATHLVDEVMPEDDLLVLNKGRIVARGPVEQVIRHSGGADLDEAFTRLTAKGEAPS
ncbi:ATP-binding cassette domain-containing protein [Pelagibius marinus]|uniref:ATP-binding cassette domain-containing protein n=1 Tax=Pelagibius marinus TaxID=2762760 RepID=UPI001872B149|nr:ATP-binding cassette domain-containing protein [Pelagibius marinus]